MEHDSRDDDHDHADNHDEDNDHADNHDEDNDNNDIEVDQDVLDLLEKIRVAQRDGDDLDEFPLEIADVPSDTDSDIEPNGRYAQPICYQQRPNDPRTVAPPSVSMNAHACTFASDYLR